MVETQRYGHLFDRRKPMNGENSGNRPTRLSVLQHYDLLCDEFESAWQAGQRPRCEDFLLRVPDNQQAALLRELLLVEFGYLRQAGVPFDRADYLARFESRRASVEAAWDAHLSQREANVSEDREKSTTLPVGIPPGLAATITSPVLSQRVTETLGTQIGPYRLLQQIGEGGFGVVFLAEQQLPVRRKVALKIIKPGMDTREVIARFEAERQALALMDHPHIARVLDAGTTDSGRPYFVMDLVKGIPITEYCDRNGIATRERLVLFSQVCQAVQHAHHKGVIHRDIKPSNILVTVHDDKPVPKVIDFGISKAISQPLTEKTLHTAFGQIIGTPQYMSPEQAELSSLDIDTRSDIYSLGVLLYELLTGSTPIDANRLRAAGIAEMQRLIREVDPPKPSTRVSTLGEPAKTIARQRGIDARKLRQELAGELDWIVMKALEKNRTRRYDTAHALVQDIDCFLRDQPVAAGPPSAIYKLSKFVRRNRMVVATVTIVASALLAGVASTSWGWLQTRRAYAKTEQTLQQLGMEQERTQQALSALQEEQSRTQTALAAQTRAKSRMWQALEAVSDTVIEEILARQPTLNAQDRAFLRRIQQFYEEIANEEGNSVDATTLRAEALSRLGGVYRTLGDFDSAETILRQSISLSGQIVAARPHSPDPQYCYARQLYNLALVLHTTGRDSDSETALRNAILVLEQLQRDHPGERTYARDLASALAKLAAVVHGARPREAEPWLRKALSLAEASSADERAQSEELDIRVLVRTELAIYLVEHGQLSEAEWLFQAAIDDLKLRVAAAPDAPRERARLANSLVNLSNLLRGKGDYVRAEQIQGESIAIQRQLVVDFPTLPDYRASLANVLSNVALLKSESGQQSAAGVLCKESIELRRKLMTDFPATTEYALSLARALNVLGNIKARDAQFADSEKATRESITIYADLAQRFPDNFDYQHELGMCRVNLATTLVPLGRVTEAASLLQEVRDVLTVLTNRFPSRIEGVELLAGVQDEWANIEWGREKFKEAQKLYEQALETRQRLARDYPDNVDFATKLGGTCCNLGGLFVSAGQLDDGVRWLTKAIETLVPVVEKAPEYATSREFLANAYGNRATALSELARHSDAARDWEGALKFGPPERHTLYRESLALSLARAGEHAQAVQLAEAELLREPKSPARAYQAACIFAISVEYAKDDDPLREQYAARALQLLTELHSTGFFANRSNALKLQHDGELDTLRMRDDFRQFVQSIAPVPP